MCGSIFDGEMRARGRWTGGRSICARIDFICAMSCSDVSRDGLVVSHVGVASCKPSEFASSPTCCALTSELSFVPHSVLHLSLIREDLVTNGSALGCSCVGGAWITFTSTSFAIGSAFLAGVGFCSMAVGTTTGSGVGTGTTSFGFSTTSGIVSGMRERGFWTSISCGSGAMS